MTAQPAANTDRELYREPKGDLPGDYYAPSVHVTADGRIGMNVGGTVYTLPIREWHSAVGERFARREHIGRLLERSSFGTPAAKATRESVSDEQAARVVKRAEELRAEHPTPDGPPGAPRHAHEDGTICQWVTRAGIDRWRVVDQTRDAGPCPGFATRGDS